MAENITSILRDLGMTDYETRIYSALLSLGKATSGEILKKAELRTGKIYEILDSIEKKGLASSIVENGVKKFSPADPRRIKDWLEEKKAKIDEQEKSIQKIIPEIMQKIGSIKGKAKIEVFTGVKGFKTAYKKEIDYYTPKNTLYVMGVVSFQNYKKEINDIFIYNLYPLREKSKVKIKKLLGEDTRGREDQEKQAEIRYMNYASLITFNIIGKLTIIGINLEEPIAISIESEEVAKGFIEQFEMLWKQAKAEETIKIYEGINGIKAVFEMMLEVMKKGETIKVLGASKMGQEKIEEYILDFNKKRIKKGVKLDAIYQYDSREIGKIRENMALTRVKYLEEGVTAPAWIDIFEDYVVTFDFSKQIPIAFLIKSQAVSQSYTQFFQITWKQAKK